MAPDTYHAHTPTLTIVIMSLHNNEYNYSAIWMAAVLGFINTFQCAHAALTEDGHETHFQVNHLSHLLLTLELLPIMLDTASSTGDGRIVIVSSAFHKSGELNPSNMEGQQSYGRTMFYNNSKLYNVGGDIDASKGSY